MQRRMAKRLACFGVSASSNGFDVLLVLIV